MAIGLKKKQGETTRGFLRRFARRIQQSGILLQARKVRFRKRQKTKRERRHSALRRIKITEEREKLRKKGLLKEEPKWKKRR